MESILKLKCIILVIVVLLIFGVFISKINADELYNYKVTGQNKQTGLVVAGQVWETDKQGNLKAKIFDEMTIQDSCYGAWIGYGVAQVGCENGYQYIVKVVEK